MPAQSHREALQRLAGPQLNVLAYVRAAAAPWPAPGWYVELPGEPPATLGVWMTGRTIYLGANLCAAAHTLATLREAGVGAA